MKFNLLLRKQIFTYINRKNTAQMSGVFCKTTNVRIKFEINSERLGAD